MNPSTPSRYAAMAASAISSFNRSTYSLNGYGKSLCPTGGWRVCQIASATFPAGSSLDHFDLLEGSVARVALPGLVPRCP